MRRWSIGAAALILLVLVSSASAGSDGGTASRLSLSPAPTATVSNPASPHVTGATVLDHADSLTLEHPGKLNLFAMANGGGYPSTAFSSGNIVTAIDLAGYPAAAIAVTPGDSDQYTTDDNNYCIGGVGVSGFQGYGEESKVLVPPDYHHNSSLTEKLVLNQSALVVVLGLSGGLNNTIVLSGIPGLVIDAMGTRVNSTCVMIGQAQLTSGTYTVTETETLHGRGADSGADLLGIFSFANSSIPETVSFTETGLPSGTNWSVTLGGTTHTSTTSAVNFTEPDGTYSYSVGVAAGFGPNPSNGTLSVNSTSLSMPVAFAPVYALTFDESTLPGNTNWSVTVTGSPSSVILATPLTGGPFTRWSDGASTIRFYVSNGTYSYSASASGFSSAAGSLLVSGQSPAPTTLGFSANPSSPSNLPILYDAILAVAVVVVAIGVVAFLRRRRRRGPSGPGMIPWQAGLGGSENPPPRP